MNYGELKIMFTTLLNRNDITPTLVDMFISLGLNRTERTLRTTMQKATYTFTVPAVWDGSIFVPNDYLGIHYMKVNDIAINRNTDKQSLPPVAGTTDEYFIEGGKFKFRPLCAEGDVITLCYYREFIETNVDDTTTVYSAIIPDVIVYAALVYACDTYVDVRKADFEQTFQVLKAEVQSLSDQDELTGMAVVNPYAGLV